jgi:choline monooxygenase
MLEDIPNRVAPFNCEQMRYVMRKEWDVACNWKVYVDNYLEGYHLPVVHPGLHKELDYDQYKVEPHRYYSIQHAPIRRVPAASTGRRLRPEDTEVAEALYVWLFPNVMLNVFMGQMQTNAVLPLSHDRTRVAFEWYAAEPPADPATDPRWSRLIEFAEEIQAEDVEICEVVQRNLRSRVYDRGRYSAARENGVHHFHSLLHEFLT